MLVATFIAGTVMTQAAVAPGTKLWNLGLGGPVRISPAIGADGTIYSGCATLTQIPAGVSNTVVRTNVIIAVQTNGVKKWSLPAPGDIAIGPDQTVYAGGWQEKNITLPSGDRVPQVFGAFSAVSTNGVRLWSQTNVIGFAIGADGNIYAAVATTNGQSSNTYYGSASISPGGSNRWQTISTVISALPEATMLIGPDGASYLLPQNLAVSDSPSGSLAIASDPLIIFDAEGAGNPPLTPANTFLACPTLTAQGAMLAGVFSVVAVAGDEIVSGPLCAFDATGKKLWQSSLTSTEFSPAVVAADGTIYVGTAESTLCALTSTGSVKWQFNAGSQISASPALAQDGTIYCGTDDGIFYAVSTNGASLWQFTADASIRAAPVIDANGVVYFGSEDGNLYAIQGSAPLAHSPWPMFRHDAAHTGRAFQAGLRAETSGAAGQTQLRLILEPSGNYLFETSTNLTNWQSSLNLNGMGGIVRTNLANTPGSAKGFYRMSGTPGN